MEHKRYGSTVLLRVGPGEALQKNLPCHKTK